MTLRWPALLLLLPILGCATTTAPLDDDDDDIKEPEEWELHTDPAAWPDELGGDRPVEVRAPADYDGSAPLPLMILLHGYGADGPTQTAFLRMHLAVEDPGMILLSPNGSVNAENSRYWNATDFCCDFEGTGVDDVAYLEGLIDEAIDTLPIDQDRIWFAGHSNGGFMSYRMACEIPHRIDGIAALAGTDYPDDDDCVPDAGVRVLHIHGTDDSTIEYEGEAGIYVSARGAAERWADRAGCSGAPEPGSALDLMEGLAGPETTVEDWSGCEQDLEVSLWTLEGADHIPFFTDAFQQEVIGWLNR